MGFGDRFRRVIGLPDPPSEEEVRWLPFKRALAEKDAQACLNLAFGFMRAQQHADAVKAFELLEQGLPERRAEWLRWQGQSLYIGLALSTPDPAKRREAHLRALECYLRAAEAGDRTQEFNAVELCEHLAREELPAEQQRALFDRYLALFPEGPGRGKVLALRAALSQPTAG